LGLACPSCCTLSLRSLGASASLARPVADVVADVGACHPVTLRQFRRSILVFVFSPKFADPKTFSLWENAQGNFGKSIYPKHFDPETFWLRGNG